MNIFKSVTFDWRQIAVFKLGLLALGVLIGAYWPALFAHLFLVLGLIAIVSLAYITYVWWKA